MAKLLALSLSLCFLLFSGCFAFRRQQPEQNNVCQFDSINALEPDNRIESEAGYIETWNPFSQEFLCSGFAFARWTLNHNGLRRPFYTDAPQEIFIEEGTGYLGMLFPGCPSTYEEPQGGQGQQQAQDRHQKVHRFRKGDVIAVPAGVAIWMFNDQKTPVVAVSVLHTASLQNQLDQFPRIFYLAGNQENEFLQYQQEQEGSPRSQFGLRKKQQSRKQQEKDEGEDENENESGSIYAGFTSEFLEQAFQVSKEIVSNVQGENEEEEKGAILKVKGGLHIIRPQQLEEQGREEEEKENEDDDEQEQEERPSRRNRRNGIEETLCTLRLRSNIGSTAAPDIYNPQAGSIRVLNDLDFPILKWLGLSAEYGSLRRNAMFVPHSNLNANSAIYVLEGNAHVQVVDCNGKAVFDGKLKEGSVLTVPQNFAVAAKSHSDRFRYVAFKTNARPSIATLAGGTSLINAMPEEVVAESFGLNRDQARQLKKNNSFKFLVPPNPRQMRAVA